MKKIILTVAAVFVLGFANAQEVKFGVKGGLNLSTIKSTFPSINGKAVTSPDNKMAVGFHVGGFAEIGLSDKLSFQPELLFSMEGAKFESTESGTKNIGNQSFTYTDNKTKNIVTNYINVPLLIKFKATENLFFVAGPQVGFLMSAKEDYEIKSTQTSNGQTYTYTDSETSNIVTNYINVPLLIKFKATENLFFVAGPQVGFLMSAKQDYESKSTETTNNVTTTSTDSKSGLDVKKQFESMSYALDLGAGYFFTENIFAELRYNLGLSNNAKPVTENFGGVNYTYEPVYKANTLQVSFGYRF